MDGAVKDLRAEKKALRSKIIADRRKLTDNYRQRASNRMMTVFCALPDFKEPRKVLCYASMADEVQIRPLMEKWLSLGVTVALPKITGKGQIEAMSFTDFDSLVEGEYGILTNPGRSIRQLVSDSSSYTMGIPDGSCPSRP